MFALDFIVCLAAVAVEHVRTRSSASGQGAWARLVVLSVVGAVLITGGRSLGNIWDKRTAFSNLGEWCEVDFRSLQDSSHNLDSRISFFTVRHTLPADITFIGQSWDGLERRAEWTSRGLLDVDNRDSSLLYAYDATVLTDTPSETNYGVTKLDFARLSGWYMSKTYGKVMFTITRLEDLESELGLSGDEASL